MPVFLALYLPDFRAVAIWNLEAMRLFVGLFWGHNDAFQKPETEFTCINVSYFFSTALYSTSFEFIICKTNHLEEIAGMTTLRDSFALFGVVLEVPTVPSQCTLSACGPCVGVF